MNRFVVLAAMVLGAAGTPAIASYVDYTFTSYRPASTSGTFSIAGGPGNYYLSAFSGRIGGISYDLSTVGLARTSINAYFLGGLVNGVDDMMGGTNDFGQYGVFIPRVGTFDDKFYYTTAASSTVDPTIVTLVGSAGADYRPVDYRYAYSSVSQGNSGTFTISDNQGVYTLSAFSGSINGIAYTTATAGLMFNSINGVALAGTAGGLSDHLGVDIDDFFQDSGFFPGQSSVSDFFVYSSSRPGAPSVAGAKVYFSLLGATSPVPEPATWAMMIAGFGVIGAAMRRRKAAVRFA